MWSQIRKIGLADWLQIIVAICTAVSLVFVGYQIQQNNKTAQVSIRGQLYDREAGIAVDESTDPNHAFGTVWANVPPQVTHHTYAVTRLGLITKDADAMRSPSPAALFDNMFNTAVFADPARRERTGDLRRTFLFVQTNLYHVHLSHDYWQDDILTTAEWHTWKGIVREMHAHPMLLTAIWHGHKHRYMSRGFARFLQREICDPSAGAEMKRDCEFVKLFYPAMMRPDWPDTLPDY